MKVIKKVESFEARQYIEADMLDLMEHLEVKYDAKCVLNRHGELEIRHPSGYTERQASRLQIGDWVVFPETSDRHFETFSDERFRETYEVLKVEDKNVTFIQNNYSPEGLSAADVYRNTKDLLTNGETQKSDDIAESPHPDPNETKSNYGTHMHDLAEAYIYGSDGYCRPTSVHEEIERNIQDLMKEEPVEKARRLVAEHHNIWANSDTADDIDYEDTSLVWFAYVLGGWKALVITKTVDASYYEVTYNKDKRETYVDHYEKTRNQVVPDRVCLHNPAFDRSVLIPGRYPWSSGSSQQDQALNNNDEKGNG